MKKKIAILGSTGSIGKTLINILKKDKKNFEIILLSADGNYKELLKQAKHFKVKNLIITNELSYNKIKNRNTAYCSYSSYLRLRVGVPYAYPSAFSTSSFRMIRVGSRMPSGQLTCTAILLIRMPGQYHHT